MFEKIYKSSSFAEIKDQIVKNQIVKFESLWHAPKALITAFFQKVKNKPLLFITSLDDESHLQNDLPYFTNCTIAELPSWEVLPHEKIEPSPDIVGERALVLSQILRNKTDVIYFATLPTLLTKVIAKDQFLKLIMQLAVGKVFDFNQLATKLVYLGYQRTSLVNDKGQFAIRGGIIDVFPSHKPEPFRIEFFGDEVESIRSFDMINQKSIERYQELEILPTLELKLLDEFGSESLLSYFNDFQIVINEPQKLKQKYQQIEKIYEDRSPYFLGLDELLKKIKTYDQLHFSNEPFQDPLAKVHVIKHPFKKVDESFESKTKLILEEGQTRLLQWPKIVDPDFEIYYCVRSITEKETFLKKLNEQNQLEHKNVQFIEAHLSDGFVIENQKLAYITTSEIQHKFFLKRKKQRTAIKSSPVEFTQLSVGDFVVHISHGIGKYVGCSKKDNHLGHSTEFLVIEYADQARLFVPLEQSHLVTKFIGSKGVEPKLHQIGGKTWIKTKAQTQRAISDYASELLSLYAKRSIKEGHKYPVDSSDQIEFEKEFPYHETPDQLEAVSNIKDDLMSQKPLDRLICGDVGYGKTEVALRAAFKAVVDGSKQVAVLVPTTVLAMQHYETFCDRMKNFPVNIGVLSRFVPKKKQLETLQGLRQGSLDIVIGTHRVISRDVEFKDLGLIVIDEEQRFGVKAKEHLKALKEGADCLTLSATPIPRTLYMSLVGARDISLINSPPLDRLPIKSYVVEKEDALLKQAITRELMRDGQVYFIHNRVGSIYTVAQKLQKLVPDAKIVVGHGQMDAKSLDDVFHQFKSKVANILVSTTIVENGIDIPEANTILIDNADQFGLSDLYQLRGRVGRWNRRAYCYFLVKKNKALLEIAQKRLDALIENSGYGGGMKIALRDLEIRGAGEILGTTQSGHVSSIGFHLYCKLLKRTILALQGKAPKVLIDTKLDFLLNATIDEDYISDLVLRMEIYQRLGEAFEMKQLEEILEEVVDRFGNYPVSFSWLYHLMRVKIFAGANRFTYLGYKTGHLKAEQKGKTKLNTFREKFILPDNPIEFEEKVIKKLSLWR